MEAQRINIKARSATEASELGVLLRKLDGAFLACHITLKSIPVSAAA